MSVELKGLDVEIFEKNLNRELTQEEIKDVRAWALPDEHEVPLEIYPTDEQMKAIKSLERALKKCCDAGVYFHNCYGKLIAYDGKHIKEINNNKSKISCTVGYDVKHDTCFDSWADDAHYVHMKRR